MKNILFGCYASMLFLAMTVSPAGRAQSADGQEPSPVPVFNSPDGAVVVFGGSSIGSDGKDNEGAHFALSRAASEAGPFKPLPLPGMVKSMAAFKKRTGDAFVRQLRYQLKLSSEQALWTYLQQHADLSAYGMASFSVPFRIAMGAAYVDEEVKAQKGMTYVYKIDVDGGGKKASFSSGITIGQAPDFGSPVLTASKVRDSSITLRWKVRLKKDIPYLADAYRQTGGRGPFVKLPTRILATHKGDSAVFLFAEKVVPHKAYRYFIRPMDLLENAGAATSDTASAIAANFHRLPFITHVKTKDTLSGIWLSWQPLQADPLITGIEIQRSRDSRGDYVVIDTVGAQSVAYLDKKLLPHVAYYYRLTVLHGGRQSQSEKYYTSVSADQQKTSVAPDAPYGFVAEPGIRGVLLHWRPVNDPDLYAYYVYRGTSLDAPMEVISPSLADTVYMDTTSHLSRQTAYVYAVKAVTNAGRESPWSEKIAARLPGGVERPRTPGGIQVQARVDRLFVQWEDVKSSDPSVLGYILYKHPAGQPLTFDVKKAASVEATRLGLQLAVPGALTTPYYEDTLPAGNWEYLVSVIDVYGAESGLSPAAVYRPSRNGKTRPPARILARPVKEGISLQWEQGDASGVEGYALYRRPIQEKAARLIAKVKGNVNQFTDRRVTAGVLYVYTVATVTAAGETPQGDEVTARPVK
jgi:hypothetical protein